MPSVLSCHLSECHSVLSLLGLVYVKAVEAGNRRMHDPHAHNETRRLRYDRADWLTASGHR